MPDTRNGDNLDAARSRLETALSTLAHGVASTRGTLDAAATIAEEKAQMATRLSTLEQENLKLHEQVATLALQPASSEAEKQVDILTHEKAALLQETQQLKNSYAALQEEMQTSASAVSSNTDTTQLQALNAQLKAEITAMQQDKSEIRAELDKTIADLENMLETA